MIGKVLLFWHMHQHAENLSKLFVVHVFNMGPISVCTGIDANIKILNFATTCVCYYALGECFNGLFLLSKSRLLFVHFFFSQELCGDHSSSARTLHTLFPNKVCKWAIVDCAVWRAAPSCWNYTNLFWFGVYSWLRSSLIRFNTSL